MTISIRANLTPNAPRPMQTPPRVRGARRTTPPLCSPGPAAAPLEAGRGERSSVAARGDVRTSAVLPHVAQSAATTAALMLAGAVIGSRLNDKPGDFIPMGAIVGSVAAPVAFHTFAPIAKAAMSGTASSIGRSAGEVALNGVLAAASAVAGCGVEQAVTGERGMLAGLWGTLAGPLVFMSLKAALGTPQATLISAAICGAAFLPKAMRS